MLSIGLADFALLPVTWRVKPGSQTSRHNLPRGISSGLRHRPHRRCEMDFFFCHIGSGHPHIADTLPYAIIIAAKDPNAVLRVGIDFMLRLRKNTRLSIRLLNPKSHLKSEVKDRTLQRAIKSRRGLQVQPESHLGNELFMM